MSTRCTRARRSTTASLPSVCSGWLSPHDSLQCHRFPPGRQWCAPASRRGDRHGPKGATAAWRLSVASPLPVLLHSSPLLQMAPSRHCTSTSSRRTAVVPFPRALDASANSGRVFYTTPVRQFLIIDARHFDMDINTVEHRPADALLITRDGSRRTGAFFDRIAKVATRTPRAGSCCNYSLLSLLYVHHVFGIGN